MSLQPQQQPALSPGEVLFEPFKQRITALWPFYYAFAMAVLPRSATICAVRSSATGLTRISRVGQVQAGFHLVHSLAVHPALVDAALQDVCENLRSSPGFGEWFDLQRHDAEELAYSFTDECYLSVVDANAGRLMLPPAQGSPIAWCAAMEAQLTAAETWLVESGHNRLFEHGAAGVTRLTFRPGRHPLAEHYEPWMAEFSGSPYRPDQEEQED